MSWSIKDAKALVVNGKQSDPVTRSFTYFLNSVNAKCAYDSTGKVYAFYENGKNISCAVSYNGGIDFYRYDNLIRLLQGERVGNPYITTNNLVNHFFLFYIYNDNYLAYKTIDTTLFLPEDAYKWITDPPKTFEVDTNDDDLSIYTDFGQIMRKGYSVLIDGLYTSNESPWPEIINVNPTRLSEGKSIRFLPGKSRENYRNNASLDSFSAYFDALGVLRLWLMRDGLMNIVSSYDMVSWQDTLTGMLVHQLSSDTDDYSYDYKDFQSIYRWFTFYGDDKDVFGDVYSCQDGYNPVQAEDTLTDEWLESDRVPPSNDDIEAASDLALKQFDVVYDIEVDKITLLLLFNNGMYVRYMPNDFFGIIDTLTDDKKKSKGYPEGTIEYIVENVFNLTKNSPNKLVFLSGRVPEEDDSIIIGSQSAPTDYVMEGVRPAGCISETGLVNVFYFDDREGDVDMENCDEASGTGIRYVTLNQPSLIPYV